VNDALQGNTRGIGFVMCGTPEFLLDTRRGLYSYEALRGTIRFVITLANSFSPPVSTGTEANRLKTQGYYGYYGGGYRSYAYSSGLHRRWHWSHRHR
jgi:P-loop Domain of unknown function (DUF2791)